MIRQMKQKGIGVLLLAAALLQACSLEDGCNVQQLWHVSIPVGEQATRSVYTPDAGASLKSMWNDSQTVVAYSDNSEVGDLTASGNATGGSTTITGDISGTYTAGTSTLTLYSPAKLSSATYTEYATQDGTIDGTNGISSLDYMTATVTVTAVDASNGLLSTSYAEFSRLQSFTKFTFTEAVNQVVISAEGMSDITVTAAADQTVFYVALPLDGTKLYTFVGTSSSSVVYYGQMSGTLTRGKYYTAAVDLQKEFDATATISSWGDGDTLPGGNLIF